MKNSSAQLEGEGTRDVLGAGPTCLRHGEERHRPNDSRNYSEAAHTLGMFVGRADSLQNQSQQTGQFGLLGVTEGAHGESLVSIELGE